MRIGSKSIKAHPGRCLLKNRSDRLFLSQYSYPGPSGEDVDTGSANLAMSDHRVLRRCAWNGRCRA
jgi:hypothetical protein